ncbi:MAG: acyltransferase domain-containing protein, partial [bacterium]|nr:acyltransferase domain-containing protein [bacterium]
MTDSPRSKLDQGNSRSWQLLLLSARSDSALEAAARTLGEHLVENPHLDLADVAYTLHVDRRASGRRCMLTSKDVADAAACLKNFDPARVVTASAPTENGGRPVWFLFPGIGAQYVNMGRELYETEPAFQTQIDHCSQQLLPRLGCDLRKILYPAADQEQKAIRLLGEIRFADPALFVVECALAKLWIEWGVRPQAMIGHSLGEFVAACLAGVFSLKDGLAIVAEQGRMLQTSSAPGAMLSLSLSEQEAAPFLGEELSFAAVNAPSRCVVSGSVAAVEALDERLAARGVERRRLHFNVGAHSQCMDPVVPRFVEEIAKIRLKPPRIPYVSNVTGKWIRDEEATDPGYWGRHMRRTVRFMAGLNVLSEHPDGALLEIGPGRTLITLAKKHPLANGRPAFYSMRHSGVPGSDAAFLLKALGRLWLGGVAIDWEGFCAGRRRRRLELPATPASSEGEVLTAEPRRRRTDAGAAPRNPVEELVAGIWEQVLGAIGPAPRRLGIHDDFFELGGDSLTATRVLSRIGRELGVEPPPRTLFEHPTVAGLAEYVAAARRGEREEVPALQPAEHRDPLPLSFAQQRLWFLDRLEPGSALYNIPIALRLRGRLDRDALARALSEIVRRHEALRTTFDTVDGVPAQVVRPVAGLALPVLDLTGLEERERRAEARRLALDEAR